MDSSEPWPHAPPHFTSERGIYMVTASTYEKEKLFRNRHRLRFLHDTLLALSRQYDWELQAWAVFSNHYHFVGVSPQSGANNLSPFLKHLHANSARFLNQLDNTIGRKVWHNFWESRINYDSSHYARLHYVNANAVHHGLVHEASQYPWSSAKWFERSTSVSFQKMVESHRCDRLTILDDF